MIRTTLLIGLILAAATPACASNDDAGGATASESALDQARAATRATIEFRGDGRHAQHGAIVAGGTLTVDYDLTRLPQCFGSTYQGSPAWSTSVYARFAPGGQTASALVSDPVYEPGRGTRITDKRVDLDVPADATSVELWFATGGEVCQTHYDSNSGANFAFSIVDRGPSQNVAWAGDWGSLVSRGCLPADRRATVPEPLVYDSWVAQRATCRYVEADVYVPGVTDGEPLRPELVIAEVEYRRDGGAAERSFLGFVERVGNNYRVRWDLDRSGIDFVRGPWTRLEYAFRFSTDGVRWYRVAQGGGPDGGAARTIVREAP